jgi:hypothetical protein
MPAAAPHPATEVSRAQLLATTETLAGPRHGRADYSLLSEKAGFIEETFRSLGLGVSRPEVEPPC